jgi:DnaK suppressor protein
VHPRITVMATPAQFASFRTLLEERRASLREEIRANDASALAPVNLLAAHDVTDRKDVAGQVLATELLGAEVQRDVDELGQVEAALLRLDVGTYGDCVDCGNVIAPARLRVQPAAPRCTPCQVAAESRRR